MMLKDPESHGRCFSTFSQVLPIALCLLPLAFLLGRIATERLGANPVEAVLHDTGSWALRLLLLTLAISPLQQVTGHDGLKRLRRPLGLFTLFYATLHLAVYLVLDRGLDWQEVLTDLTERPYILVGFAAWVPLVALASTSTSGWHRRLGHRWQWLHRAIYPSALLAVLHYVWLVKADLFEPLVYAALLTLLLAWRLPWSRYRRPAGKARPPDTPPG